MAVVATASLPATTASIMTTTLPMISIFTPPASCSSSWTYEPQAANDVMGGLIVQNAATSDHVNPACWPSGFDHYGRVRPTQRFSPGWCPVGYTSVDKAINRGVTSAACCLSGLSYSSSIDGPNGIYAGCITMLPSDSSVILTVRQETSSSTEITGPVTIWGQPILIAMESSDMSLFASATITTSFSSVPTEQSTSTTQSLRSSFSSSFSSSSSSSSTAQSTSTGGTQSNPSTPEVLSDGGLSTGVKAGIGVGAAVGALGVIALIAALVILRRRKQTASHDHALPGPQQSYSPASTSQIGSYYKQDGYVAELNGHKERPGEWGMPPAELPGGMR